MIESIKKSLPSPIVDWVYRKRMKLRIAQEFAKDFRRYVNNAAYEDKVIPSHMTARAVEVQGTKDYHRVEKGLTLPEPKRPFGAAVGERLDQALHLVPQDASLFTYMASAREALSVWNEDGTITDSVSPFPQRSHSLSEADVRAFFESRHSVRHFDANRPVEPGLLEDAVQLAQSTPSVCNRQSWHVRFIVDSAKKAAARSNQNGNAGFGEIPVLAVVTTDSRLFAGPGERNQAWIDGGLFAMSLTWALHGLGLATCMLNMSVSNKKADALRRDLGIGAHEVIIMQIAIGYAHEQHRVARSPRRMPTEVSSIVED
ncbi:nitroreductase family protein [Brevibacterium senegalense]|uniref:nitroreductase family protein n=1 Tax=Brevibacterium senegalense TaxID=1033736 RepID=UPI0009FF38B1|nr:nitroreductase family protein [Brevibacterium senegalense]